MRLLYLYPEEWTGHRAREVHTLCTCAALAHAGADVTLVTGGGRVALEQQTREIAGALNAPGLRVVALSRSLGPIRSAALLRGRFEMWLRGEADFEAALIIHLKAAAMVRREGIPFLYEAHEVFGETTQKSRARHEKLHELEREVLASAQWRVATSRALATALRAHYVLPDDFAIVPNAGGPPLAASVGSADGPLVYAGSIADWKGLDLTIDAARRAALPMTVIGGALDEWEAVKSRLDIAHVTWRPRVPLAEIPAALNGARAGLISTQPTAASGRYSCPMKLFDYARCGLPVLSTALPSLASLDVGSWCTQVPKPTVEAWTEAMREFRFRPVLAETARAWAGAHTWGRRAEALLRVLARGGRRR